MTNMKANDSLSDFSMAPFTAGELTHDVYSMGVGPAVVILPEVPGITPPVAESARRVCERGLTVFIPSLFGNPGRPRTNGYRVRSFTRSCGPGVGTEMTLVDSPMKSRPRAS